MLIEIEPTPNPATRKFLPGRTVMETGGRDFPNAEAAEASPRATPGKPPACIITEFAEAGMKFTLTFWISDPDGMDKVKSDVMLTLWDAFKHEQIRVPYPVREIRIRGGALPAGTTVEVPG